MLDRLERIFGRLAVPNLALYIVMGQVFVLLGMMMQVVSPEVVFLAPAHLLDGQLWRAITFMFLVPPPTSTFGYVFMVFGWYLFFLMGRALEQQWGVFRFNVFILFNMALTIALSFVSPLEAVTNLFILGSVFLAFAYLNPDFELLLFFILPLKIKWLALVTWLLFLRAFVLGGTGVRVQIAATVVTFLLFFGRDILRRGQQKQRVATYKAAQEREKAEPRHVCHVCGKTDLTHPDLDFRYCSKCAGDQCYCPEHIQNHAHVVAPENEAGR